MNHWFNIFEEIVKKLGTEDPIWNSDESGLPSEPKKCKASSLKGQKTLQIVTGSDRDKTTLLAAVSASGKTFPYLTIF